MITVFSHPKGGVGKTLLAFNYSVYSSKRRKTIVVDLDGQNSITMFNAIRSQNDDLSALDIKTFDNTEALIEFLKNVNNDDFVVIDTGGFDSAYNRLAIAFADRIITPVSDSPVELMRLIDFDRILNEISAQIGNKLKIYIVLNKFNANTKNFDYVFEPFKDKQNFKFLNSVVRERSRIKFSVANGKSVFEESKGNRDKKAIQELKDLFKEIDNL